MEEESTVEYKTEIAEKRPQVVWSLQSCREERWWQWKLPVDCSFRQKQGPSLQEILPSKPPQEVHPQKPIDS